MAGRGTVVEDGNGGAPEVAENGEGLALPRSLGLGNDALWVTEAEKRDIAQQAERGSLEDVIAHPLDRGLRGDGDIDPLNGHVKWLQVPRVKRRRDPYSMRRASGSRSVMGVVGVTKKSCVTRAGWSRDGLKGKRFTSRTASCGFVSRWRSDKTCAFNPNTSRVSGVWRFGGKSVCWMRSITCGSVRRGTLLPSRVPWSVGITDRKDPSSRGHSTRASRMGGPLGPSRQN